MTDKRYFEKEYEGEYYIFDSYQITEKEFEEKLDYDGYKAFGDCLTGDEIVNRLNKLQDEKEIRCDPYKKEIERLKLKIKELLETLNRYKRTFTFYENLRRENHQLRNDLINHSALISMLEYYQALNIDDILWNLTRVESEEEFEKLYKPHLEKAKKRWE